MAIANFFDKVALSASQRLTDYNESVFQSTLESHTIGIAFAQNALDSHEGKCSLDLLIRMISRLYPTVSIEDISQSESGCQMCDHMKSLALDINPRITFNPFEKSTVIIYVGRVGIVHDSAVPALFIGSNNWLSFFSPVKEQACGDSKNPMGAGASACFAAANLFRFIFASTLSTSKPDDDFTFSTYNHGINQSALQGPDLPSTIPLAFTLLGTGAIGNAVIWSILNLQGPTGNITMIDGETVALSNLQRYALMGQEEVTKEKVAVMAELLKVHPHLQIDPICKKWQEVLGSLSMDQMNLIVTAIDTREQRIQIQGSLPKIILNAWTSAEGLGVSRHLDFLTDVCLACIYLPVGKEKSRSQIIAEVLSASEPFIRQYLANSLPIDHHFISVVSQTAAVEPARLAEFLGQQVEVFFSDAICGGRIMPAQSIGKPAGEMTVPLAHESILAGLLLAAEIITENIKLRQDKLEPLTKINLMQPVHDQFKEEEEKHYSGRCICHDAIFRERYQDKWSVRQSVTQQT